MRNRLLSRRIEYHACLEALRAKWKGARLLPESRFFLFGMGPRRKLLYLSGKLRDALSGESLYTWPVIEEAIFPPGYAVYLRLEGGGQVEIVEDEEAVWLVEDGQRRAISHGQVNLPKFQNHPWAPVLRVLHQEILVSIVDGKPVPNLWAYPRPWYRDGAMMAMVLKETGNLALLRDWILSLREPTDRNNAGETEADNLGQALYLVSLVSNQAHPLVQAVLHELPRFTREGSIYGRTDFAEHPVYATKWAKFGLSRLGLPDPFQIPRAADSYSSLFWWDFQDQHVPCDRMASADYPYLTWAEDTFYDEHNGPMGSLDYPLTWEANASQANYTNMGILSSEWSAQKICAPHSWHAAEMFLRLYKESSCPQPSSKLSTPSAIP